MSRDWPQRIVRVGPFAFLLRTPLAAALRVVDHLYRDYPRAVADDIVDYTVAVVPTSPLRRWLRPNVRLACDIEIPLMLPMPARHAGLAFEMGMNLQLAAGMHRYLLLHAAVVERGGGALLMTGDSGAGKSTLAAVLAYGGWRLLGDEFGLIDAATGMTIPFPRPISLKNASIAHAERFAPAERFGPTYEATVKGLVRHLLPPAASIAAMDMPARPRLIVTPAFAAEATPVARRIGVTELFVRLTQSSTNYEMLGEAGFEAIWHLASQTPAYEIRYGSSEAARALIDELWGAHDR